MVDNTAENVEEKVFPKPENAGETRDEKGRFIPGVSGHPEGKPKGSLSLVALIKEELEKEHPDLKEKYAKLFIKNYLAKATHRDKLMVDVINRVDGMPKQSIDVTGEVESYSHRDLDESLEADLKEFIQWKKDKLLK